MMHECNNGSAFAGSACFLKFRQPSIWLTRRQCGTGEGHMDDFIGRLIADACVDRAAATQAAELPQFRIRKAPTARPCALVRSVVGTDVVVLAAVSSACSRSPRRFGSRITA